MDLLLKGKGAIVLGATRGIGRGIAEEFAAEGASVAFCARNDGQVKEMIATLEKQGGKVFGKAVDVGDSAALASFVAEAAQSLGGIDMAVSNASALRGGNAPEDWHGMVDVDVLGFVNLLNSTLPHLEQAAARSGDASLIAISSVASAMPGRPAAYGAMKGALIHLVKSYARTLAAKKIRVNVISPGTIYFDDGFQGRMKREQPEAFKRAVESNPLGRMGTPEEIGAATVFLSSPRSAFTTGANWRVDGGLTHDANY